MKPNVSKFKLTLAGHIQLRFKLIQVVFTELGPVKVVTVYSTFCMIQDTDLGRCRFDF